MNKDPEKDNTRGPVMKKEICDYVDIEVYIDPKNINWDLIDMASSPDHNVIVGYWTDNVDDEDIVRLRKRNIIQNRGTANNVEGLVDHIEHGVTELEANFPYPKAALFEYGLNKTYE